MPDMTYTDHEIEINKLTSHTHEGMTGFFTGRDVDHGNRVPLDKYRYHWHTGGLKKIYLPTYIGNWEHHAAADHLLTLIGQSADKCIVHGGYQDDYTYLQIHDAASGSSFYSEALSDFSVGQNSWLSIKWNWGISRVYLIFDTTDIDATAEIASATLRLYGETTIGKDENLVVQNGQPDYPHIPIELADYDMSLYSGDYGSIAKSAWLNNQYNDITLTDTSIVNKGGYTKMCLRTSSDISSTPPANPGEPAEDWFWFYSGNAVLAKRPQLVIV